MGGGEASRPGGSVIATLFARETLPAKNPGALASADSALKTEGARKRAPERLCEQQGIARKGEEEREARSGVQGVSSSAWLEMMKVPVGKRPVWWGLLRGSRG